MTDQEAKLVASWMRRYGLAMLWCRYDAGRKRFSVMPDHIQTQLWGVSTPDWLVDDAQGERIAAAARANARVQAVFRGEGGLLKRAGVRRD